MKMHIAEKNDSLIFRVTGDIDHHTARKMREEIDSNIEEKKPNAVILDLSETDFMDSSGLGLIIGRLRKSKENGIKFVLFNPNEAVMKILRLAGAEKMLDIRKAQ